MQHRGRSLQDGLGSESDALHRLCSTGCVDSACTTRVVTMKRDFMDWVLFVITITTALIGIAMVIYKITGHSPTIEEILLVLVVGITGLLINHMHRTAKFEGRATADIGYIKRDLHELKAEVRDIKTSTRQEFAEIKQILIRKKLA
jgi:hypothetical protein